MFAHSPEAKTQIFVNIFLANVLFGRPGHRMFALVHVFSEHKMLNHHREGGGANVLCIFRT